MEKGIKKYTKHKGVRGFFIRAGVFATVLFAVQMGIMLYFRHSQLFYKYLKIPESFYLDFLSGLSKTKLLNSVIFIAIAFVIYIRRDLLKLKYEKQDWKETAWWGVATAGVLIAHYLFKYLVKINLSMASHYVLLITLAKLLFDLAFVVLLAYAVFNKKFIHEFLRKFWKVMLTFTGLTVVYYFVIEFFQKSWFLLSVFVSKVVYYLLSLTYADAMVKVTFGEAPTLGAANFIVGVSKDCSGIDSLLLFLSLFIFLWVLNRDEFDQKKMSVLFILGIVGTIAYNLLRIYLIMLVGILYDPRFAIDVFHTNAGWIMFLGFFAIFWNYGSKWVYK